MANTKVTFLSLQITGDDTPALQAVLDADVWRKHLLAEQDVRTPLRLNFLWLISGSENHQTTIRA